MTIRQVLKTNNIICPGLRKNTLNAKCAAYYIENNSLDTIKKVSCWYYDKNNVKRLYIIIDKEYVLKFVIQSDKIFYNMLVNENVLKKYIDCDSIKKKFYATQDKIFKEMAKPNNTLLGYASSMTKIIYKTKNTNKPLVYKYWNVNKARRGVLIKQSKVFFKKMIFNYPSLIPGVLFLYKEFFKRSISKTRKSSPIAVQSNTYGFNVLFKTKKNRIYTIEYDFDYKSYRGSLKDVDFFKLLWYEKNVEEVNNLKELFKLSKMMEDME